MIRGKLLPASLQDRAHTALRQLPARQRSHAAAAAAAALCTHSLETGGNYPYLLPRDAPGAPRPAAPAPTACAAPPCTPLSAAPQKQSGPAYAADTACIFLHNVYGGKKADAEKLNSGEYQILDIDKLDR